MNLIWEWDTYFKSVRSILLVGFIGIASTCLAFENRTFEQVLKTDFKSCSFKKEHIFLTKNQLDKATSISGEEIDSSMLIRFKSPCGIIYVDSHIVRTLNSTVLIHINNQKIKSVKIASFLEPEQYMVPKKWIDQLTNKKLKKINKVDALSGATLSSHALKRSAKKYLGIHKALDTKKSKI